ncbi:MAG: undecaprenyldiphospho-muramoylpentapeptide beta-N-acetylglucosaminyltransferase [Clostridia bacterium]|nr:undecaprenyldiphospho-muramoylpentapeptide beta-N-acetylglucosaminyltransferase [Clostridia bacterium]
MKRIILTGGGTAGHVSPNQALIPHLLKEGWEIHYIGTKAGIERQLIEPMENVTYHAVQSGKLRRYFDLKNFTDPFRVIAGVFQSIAIVAKLHPNVLFSKGGFVSVPAVFGAAVCRVPVVMHESDITPGLANKLCKPFARRVCTTFPECAEALGPKGLCTGTPLRASLFAGSRERGLALAGFDGQKPVLMMMGGSLGAQTVNAVLREALPELTRRFDVLHVCGKGNLDESLLSLPGYRQFEYLSEELPDAFACADFMLSRAGSNSLSEILALHKPALLIPYHSGRGDQVQNAASLKARGLAHVLPQSDMTAASLTKALDALVADRDRLVSALVSLPEADGTQAVLREIRQFMRPEA